MSIFQVNDIDTILISLLSFKTAIKLSQTSKYYRIKTKERLQNYYEFITFGRNLKTNINKHNKLIFCAIVFGDLEVYKHISAKTIAIYNDRDIFVRYLIKYIDGSSIITYTNNCIYSFNCVRSNSVTILDHFIKKYGSCMQFYIISNNVNWSYS